MSFLHERVSEAKLAHINDAITAAINAQFGEGGTGEPPSPPGEILLDLNTPLTSPALGYEYGCPNAQDRPGMWARDDPQALEALVSPSAGFLNRLGQLCLGAEIRECRNQACLGNKQLIQNVAPACEWRCFRDWAILAMSCQASFTDKQRLTRSHTHLATTVSLFNTLLAWYKNRARAFDNVLVGSRRRAVDLVQVCDIIYWMLTIQARIGVGNVPEGKWGPDYIPERVIHSSVQRASEISRKIGLCQKRIQNLASVSERKEADLPSLVEAAQKHPNLKHEYHEVCTVDFCRFAEIDSTKVEQLHKCESGPSRCGQYEFPLDIVEKSIWRDGSTAWSCLESRMVTPGEKYVAISHTWSDGTGVGVVKGEERDMKEKIVNRCLFDYFARIVAKLDCTGVWWDTISIPLEKSARRKAVNNMHVNYASASCTVVHDKYLLQCDWREDGTPCLALVLSPWFTRGWTALELAKSRFVKVLYRGSDPNEPVIKDLDKDILARDPAHSTRAHWIASSLIRRLRQAVTDVSDILTILGPRSTSWERDNKLIAALLAEWTGGGYDKTEADHTRAILARLGKMGMSSLFHGYETIAATGGFSWCPHALRDLPSQSTGDLQEGVLSNTTLTVDARGAVTGSFYYRLVTLADTRDGALVQHNASPRRPRSQYAMEQNISNPPDRNRVKDALRSRQTCLLLRDHWQSAGPALLVATVGKAEADNMGDIIDCRYIASVFDHTQRPTEQYDSRYKFGTARLGNEQGRPDVDASRLLGLVGDYDGGGTSGRGGFDSSFLQPHNELAGEDEEDDEDVSSDGADGWESETSDGPAVPKGYRLYH